MGNLTEKRHKTSFTWNLPQSEWKRKYRAGLHAPSVHKMKILDRDPSLAISFHDIPQKARNSLDSLAYFFGIRECLGLRFCAEMSGTYCYDFGIYVLILFEHFSGTQIFQLAQCSREDFPKQQVQIRHWRTRNGGRVSPWWKFWVRAGWGPGHHSWNMEQNLHLIPDSLIKFFPYHLGVFYVYEEPQITALFPRIISKINKVINVYK